MKWNWILISLVTITLTLSGCTNSTQDADFSQMVTNVAEDFKDQKELIIKPYAGLTPDQLRQYRSAAESAIAAAESMTLSDKSSKARGIFIEGMQATIAAVDTLEKDGKLGGSDEKVSTESVNGYFIRTQTKIDDTCDLIGIEREKTF